MAVEAEPRPRTLIDVVFDTLSLETVRDVLSIHQPETFHVNGYLTCAGCRRGVPWTAKHVMAKLQNAANMAQSGEKPRATRRNEWAAPAPSGSASGSPKSSSPDG